MKRARMPATQAGAPQLERNFSQISNFSPIRRSGLKLGIELKLGEEQSRQENGERAR